MADVQKCGNGAGVRLYIFYQPLTEILHGHVSLDAEPERTDGEHSPIEDTYWMRVPILMMAGSKRMSLGEARGSGDGVFSRIGVFSGIGNSTTGSGPHSKGITFTDSEAVKAMEKVENTTITLI